MSAWTGRHLDGQAAKKIVPPRPRIPWWKMLWAAARILHSIVA